MLGLVAACDDKPATAPLESAAPGGDALPVVPASVPAQHEAATPAPNVAKPADMAPGQIPKDLPALGSQVIKDTSLAKPAESKPKPAAKVSTTKPLPPAKLDLRLPPELVEQLQPDEPADIDFSKSPLLPEMFVEKPKEPGPFELNGRLITNDHSSEDYWNSVEGAELQFKFRN